MCMQTLYGCCLVDGKLEEIGKKKNKIKKKSKKKENKKVIYQSKVDFE